jgi:flagellar motility protein MotE (MotC chaperone)
MTSRNRIHRGKRLRSSLSLIAGLLLMSGAVRVGLTVQAAMALENTGSEGLSAQVAPVNDSVSHSMADMEGLLAALQKREARIAEQEAQMEIYAKTLEIAEQEIAQNLLALVEAETRLRETLAYADTAAEDDLARLTSVYESMKPKDAAALFEEMDPDFAAGFLARMRADAAAGILAGLTPQAAYSVSVRLAGRNANAPRE